MPHLDFFAAYSYGNRDELVARVIKEEGLDLWSKLRLLALAPGLDVKSPGLKEVGRAVYKEIVHSRTEPPLFQQRSIAPQRNLMQSLGLLNGRPEKLAYLPKGTACLSFAFTLKKPYISRDDVAFYILDNPVRKDKVFKLPMVAASGWKGNLRWMAGYHKVASWLSFKEQGEAFKTQWIGDRLCLWRLFGPEKEAVAQYFNTRIAIIQDPAIKELMERDKEKLTKMEKEEKESRLNRVQEAFDGYLARGKPPLGRDDGFRGRLHFSPTFFDAIDLEVINPHERETGTGTLPIYIESVPAGGRGEFSLLYVPLDLMGRIEGPELAAEVKEDLRLVATALRDLLLNFGFSAKKSSGFGVIEDTLVEEGRLLVKGISQDAPPGNGVLGKLGFTHLSALEEQINRFRVEP